MDATPKADVFYFPCEDGAPAETHAAGVRALFEAAGFVSLFPPGGLLAVKVHFGEHKCSTYIRPHIVRAGVELLKERGFAPFVTDTNTLYKGERHNSVRHLLLAERHGFTQEYLGCPVVISDGLRGNNEVEVKLEGGRFDSYPVAGDIAHSDGMLVFSHLTGHLAAGFGAAIKNLAMGCTPRRGKLMQHASMKPWIVEKDCTGCGVCAEWCPEGAITVAEKASIDAELCIGCGECLTVCPSNAVGFSWKQESRLLMEKMAEFAAAVMKALKGRAAFINVVMNVTKDCDCLDKAQKPVGRDVGLLASRDPVALDRASRDLFAEINGRTLDELAYPHLPSGEQVAAAAAVGLGVPEYVLHEVKP